MDKIIQFKHTEKKMNIVLVILGEAKLSYWLKICFNTLSLNFSNNFLLRFSKVSSICFQIVMPEIGVRLQTYTRRQQPKVISTKRHACEMSLT